MRGGRLGKWASRLGRAVGMGIRLAEP
jgi:hypothetical protein